MSRDPSFEIPARPTRNYSRTTVEYEGSVVFALSPEVTVGDDALDALLRGVLDDGPYRYGDWFDLPMPLYTVHDDATGDTFRVSVRDGSVELHVLPATGSPGLAALYDRLVATGEHDWTVDCRTECADD
ncbi:hypothetical protein [Halomarina oriensis]|uniref:Uncharacterized protein n=1 Tax=Halomarina oriensis TaxID=671145 RepID=A0A6B0GJT5_9EURY|nr:hypothetical protein [Halomarina oriensis]